MALGMLGVARMAPSQGGESDPTAFAQAGDKRGKFREARRKRTASLGAFGTERAVNSCGRRPSPICCKASRPFGAKEKSG